MAANSPFPPIAEYAFLSDCTTGALVAPNGNVEWLCLPRFDSPSVFGAILDRGAGFFRLAPDGVNVPVSRRYLPGTMILETSWGTRTGWVIVRDALLIGPWHRTSSRSKDLPAHPYRLRRRARAGPHRAVRERRGPAEPGLRAGVRLRAGTGRVELHQRRLHPGHLPGAGLRRRADPHGGEQPRLRGATGDGPHSREGGRHALLRPVVERAGPADGLRRGLPAGGVDRAPLATLARSRRVPRPSLADPPPTQRADPQGPHLRPDRGHGGGGHHLAAGDPRRRAELGLPVHVDPGRHLHALGPLHARIRLGGQRLLLLHRRLRRG